MNKHALRENGLVALRRSRTAKTASASSLPIDQRFEYPPYPDSWVQVAWSHELKKKEARPVTAMGRDFVLYRGEDGVARMLDAYCPHLGAHLGVGGKVVHNELRCPFHGWQFDESGQCTAIAYARKIPPKAKTQAHTVREQNGQILFWHDRQGRAPWVQLPEVPELGSPDWTRPRHYGYTLRTRWREIAENAVDRAHFHELHRYPTPPELEFRAEGTRFSMTSHVPWRRFGRKVDARLDIDGHGALLQVVRGVGEYPFLVLGSQMPIDGESLVHRMTFVVSRKIPLLIREPMVRFVIYMAMREFRRDVPIWENKIAIKTPVLCDGDGPIGRFRSWSRQFHASPGEHGAAT